MFFFDFWQRKCLFFVNFRGKYVQLSYIKPYLSNTELMVWKCCVSLQCLKRIIGVYYILESNEISKWLRFMVD